MEEGVVKIAFSGVFPTSILRLRDCGVFWWRGQDTTTGPSCPAVDQLPPVQGEVKTLPTRAYIPHRSAALKAPEVELTKGLLDVDFDGKRYILEPSRLRV